MGVSDRLTPNTVFDPTANPANLRESEDKSLTQRPQGRRTLPQISQMGTDGDPANRETREKREKGSNHGDTRTTESARDRRRPIHLEDRSPTTEHPPPRLPAKPS